MADHVIASFRATGGAGRPFLERALALVARLTDTDGPRALGGVHVGWDGFRLTFAFEVSKLAPLIDAVTADVETGAESSWAVGLAEGDVSAVKEAGSPLTESGLVWWGPPIIAASVLANLARPGEILCEDTVSAIRSGELVTSGFRIARDGTLRLRGARIDRHQPWTRHAAENLARLVEPRLVSAHLPSIELTPGALVVLRADPGAGGTRLLSELAKRATRALVISSAGSGFEPLGALRRALGRSLGDGPGPRLLELARPLDALLSGEGVSLDTGAELITAFLWPKPPATNGVIIIDDAKAVDPGTLEACVRAVRKASALQIIARLDATGGLPSALAGLPRASEYEIGVLSRAGAEELAVNMTDGALDARARGRWTNLGGTSPLGIVAAITHGVASSEITWIGDRASPRGHAAGRGKPRTAAKWIRARANAEKAPVRVMLSLLAVCGGEAKLSFLSHVLEKASLRVDPGATIAYMLKTRWVVRHQDGWVALPSRTHQSALFSTLEGEAKKKLHVAVARTIAESDGVFGRVEGAWHAVQAGQGAEVSSILLDGARATGEAALEASTTQLIAFARRADPSCESKALALLATAIARAPSVVPRPASGHPVAMPLERLSAAITSSALVVPPLSPPGSESSPGPAPHFPPLVPDAPRMAPVPAPPEMTDEPDSMIEHARIVPPKAKVDRSIGPESASNPSPPSSSQPLFRESASGGQIAVRLGELAKDALLAADNAALERWVDGLRATGESPAFTDRMRAMARIGRGDIGDALRVLRRTRSQLDPADHRRRCQTSLALGVALSAAGRSQEALLEGMDALARARQIGDERGAKACLAFLAKLYSSVSRDADAERLRTSSV